jgi:hypothetical protein
MLQLLDICDESSKLNRAREQAVRPKICPAICNDICQSLGPVGFARERLGFHPDSRKALVLASRAKQIILNCTRQWGKSTLLNPGRLAPKAQVQVCGEWHRLPPLGNSSPEPEIEDPVSVRFAPIGLMASRCFTESRKLACITCHDPHTDGRPRSDRFHTERCLACHGDTPAPASSCRRAKREDCLPCHMRPVSLTDYLKFTDHRIRIY